MTENVPSPINPTEVDRIRGELAKGKSARWQRMLKKFVAAALGSVPWVGGFLSAAANAPADEVAERAGELRTQWIEEHERKLGQLHGTLNDVAERFEKLGPEIEERVE